MKVIILSHTHIVSSENSEISLYPSSQTSELALAPGVIWSLGASQAYDLNQQLFGQKQKQQRLTTNTMIG